MLLFVLKCAAPRRITNKFIEQLQRINKRMNVEESSKVATFSTSAISSATPKMKQQPPQLRRERQQLAAKRKTVAYIPGIVSLQVLGAGANGAPSSVYLFTDQSRYLFNCGEGTQRLAHEHKTKLSRLEQIFVTRNTWQMVGGFPGLALTVQDTGVKELAIHGPPHLDSILQSMWRFVVLKNLQVKTKDCTQIQEFEDAVMSVKCLPLWRHNCESPSKHGDNVVVAYICNLKPRPGALDLVKCVEHGVPPGPLLGLLKNGSDVTLENGNVVKSEDVSEPNEVPQSFIFLDIPTDEFLPALEAQASLFHDLQLTEGHKVTLVVHFSPENILRNNRFQSFMQNFSTETQHIYLNSTRNSFSGYIAANRIQYQLNQLNPRVFPLLAESAQLNNSFSIGNKKTKLIEDDERDNSKGPVSLNAPELQNYNDSSSINSMTNFHLRPKKGLDQTMEAKLNPIEYVNETHVLENFPALLAELHKVLPAVNPDPATDFPKITFLGTGSCIPNKTRNVSSILMQPHESSYILLDCGEGTLGQIIRFFGKEKANDVIKNLRAIYVSHLHADHHIGLIGLLNERQRLVEAEHRYDKVLLFAPVQIQSWLNFYDETIESINGAYELIGNSEMLEQPLELQQSHKDLGVMSIATCLVRHCQHSFGVSFTLSDSQTNKPIKITYSGDSMPCKDLVELGHNSTILIHEATMEDDLEEEAKIKMHSTITQALQQGNAMQAEYIILTHFSQRYAKLPRLQSMNEETEAQSLRNVAIAFDNMQVTPADLPHFHLMYPALKALFADHAGELEQKALKRELKLERKRKFLNED